MRSVVVSNIIAGRRDPPHGGPRALAGGTPTFDRPTDLALLDVRRPEGSDNVLLRYAVRR